MLKIERVSDDITNLVCMKCGETIAVWENRNAERNEISDENRKKWA